MFVQREAERQSYTAPSADKCRMGLVTTDMRAFECCIDAIEALIFIMKELKIVLRWRNVPIPNLCADAADLLLLTNYLLRWPLGVAKTYLDTLLTQNSRIPNQLTDGFRRDIEELRQRHQKYKVKWRTLALLTAEIEHTLCSLSNVSPIRVRLLQFEDKTDEDPMDIPSLGAVELLLRVVAEAKESRLIGTQ
jgi:hypothetical protein